MIEVKIVKHRTDTEAPIVVYAVNIEDGDGVWDETFGTLGELNAFIQGIRCANGFLKKERLLEPGTMLPRFAPASGVTIPIDKPERLWPR